MEVELTIESPEGEQSRVSATGASYEDALAKATELVPEGYRRIVIRKHIG
ncbi:hypothetical protein [Arthrobacter sp. MMS18-M83]|nr:hypothetical protein [Arthrobacter sp. MMS18-M83]WAH99731.1 hypothetical protein OW521_24015 [Arthrobacter sp. MMS18-M83]